MCGSGKEKKNMSVLWHREAAANEDDRKKFRVPS